MLHTCDQRFDVTGNLENFCELNKTLIIRTCLGPYIKNELLKIQDSIKFNFLFECTRNSFLASN